MRLPTATPRIDTAVLEQFRFVPEGVDLTPKTHLPGSLPWERPHTPARFRYRLSIRTVHSGTAPHVLISPTRRTARLPPLRAPTAALSSAIEKASNHRT